jgi:hypothetical protein
MVKYPKVHFVLYCSMLFGHLHAIDHQKSKGLQLGEELPLGEETVVSCEKTSC